MRILHDSMRKNRRILSTIFGTPAETKSGELSAIIMTPWKPRIRERLLSITILTRCSKAFFGKDVVTTLAQSREASEKMIDMIEVSKDCKDKEKMNLNAAAMNMFAKK